MLAWACLICSLTEVKPCQIVPPQSIVEALYKDQLQRKEKRCKFVVEALIFLDSTVRAYGETLVPSLKSMPHIFPSWRKALSKDQFWDGYMSKTVEIE